MKSRWKTVFVVFLLLVPLVAVSPTKVLAIDNSECLDCHGDPDFSKELPNGKTVSLYVDQKRFETSVHGQNDVACTDCHSDITSLNYDNDVPHPTNLKPVDCSQCHSDEADAFSESVHGDLGEDGPSCKSCHNPHYTKYLAAATAEERNKETCLKCHDPMDGHEFLPAKGLHFERLSCSACHAPKAEKLARLLPYNAVKNQVISAETISKALGADPDELLEKFDANGDGKLDTKEVLALLKEAKEKGVSFGLMGEMVADMAPEVHTISSEGISDCFRCHSEKGEMLANVRLDLPKKDGSVASYTLSKKVLHSVYPIRFYLLDSTRITLIDIIGALIVLGGVAFAGGHLTVRLLTIPLRRREK